MAPNYVQNALDTLNAELPDLDPDLARLYVLLTLTRGVNTTLEDVHDAWAVWRDTSNPVHRSLIQFEELTSEVQDLDEPYRAGIVRAAHRLFAAGTCRVCGCTDDDCSQCVAATGEACSWAEPGLCTRCVHVSVVPSA